MHGHLSFPILLGAALLAGCETAQPKLSAAPSATAPAATASAAPAAGGDDIGAAKYAVCAGQGGNAMQLAPAFLDKMPSCEVADTAPVDKLAALGGDGKIIEGQGDCQFNNGISCHFHTSMEFVNSSKLKDDEHAVGEMHCIVPSANTDSPTVYGAHLRCKAGTSITAGKKACSADLLKVLAASRCKSGWKCCDNGTLTKPVGKQSDAEKKLRPDFRICQDESIEIDCGLLHDMHGHTANVTGLGEEFNGKFNAGDHGGHGAGQQKR